MLRIDVVRKTSDQAILKIAGRLADAEVAFLDEELTHWLARAGLVILDLNGVTFIDEQGLAMLKRRPQADVQLRSESRFIRTLLEAHGLQVS